MIPDYRDVVVNNVHVLGTGGLNTFRGWDAAHPIGITLNNVVFDNEPISINVEQHERGIWAPGRKHQTGGDGRDRDRHRSRAPRRHGTAATPG